MEAGVGPASGSTPALGSVVRIDEGRIQAHLDEVVRATVQETLNALLVTEAELGKRGRLSDRNVRGHLEIE